MNRPKEGSFWRHHSGRVYRVMFIANLPGNDRYPETVVYEGVWNMMKWSRPLSDWHRSMTEIET